jgi:4-hydroxybenzoate polyprenyltransferase
MAAAPAAAVALHTYGVTALSRHEVSGGGADTARTALACAVGAAALTAGALAASGRRDPKHPRPATTVALTAAFTASYLARYGRALTGAAHEPAAHRVAQAVQTGILGLLPLQAALTAAAGSPAPAAAVAAVRPLAGRLVKAVAAT